MTKAKTLAEIWLSDVEPSSEPELPPTGGNFSKTLEKGLREAITYKQTLSWVYRRYKYCLVYSYLWSERGTFRTRTLYQSSVLENAEATHAAILALPVKPVIQGNPKEAWQDYYFR